MTFHKSTIHLHRMQWKKQPISPVRTDRDLNQPEQTQRHWLHWLPVTVGKSARFSASAALHGWVLLPGDGSFIVPVVIEEFMQRGSTWSSVAPPPYLPCLFCCWWQNATYKLRRRERGTKDDSDILFHNGFVPCVNNSVIRVTGNSVSDCKSETFFKVCILQSACRNRPMLCISNYLLPWLVVFNFSFYQILKRLSILDEDNQRK